MSEIKPKTYLEKIIEDQIMSFDFSDCDECIKAPLIKRQIKLNKGRLPEFYNNRWYKNTPKTISSLASNSDSDEAKNLYALDMCREHGVNHKLFIKRPTEEQILKHKKIEKKEC